MLRREREVAAVTRPRGRRQEAAIGGLHLRRCGRSVTMGLGGDVVVEMGHLHRQTRDRDERLQTLVCSTVRCVAQAVWSSSMPSCCKLNQ